MNQSENRFYRERLKKQSCFVCWIFPGLALAMSLLGLYFLLQSPVEPIPVEPPMQLELPALQKCLDTQARLLGLSRDSDAVFNVCVDILGDM